MFLAPKTLRQLAAELTEGRTSSRAQQRLAEVNCDTMLMPTVPVVVPAIAPLQASDELYGSTNLLMLRNPTFINFLDRCALSLPCHAPGAAPVGLMLAGVRGQDRHALELVLAVEQALSQ